MQTVWWIKGLEHTRGTTNSFTEIVIIPYFITDNCECRTGGKEHPLLVKGGRGGKTFWNIDDWLIETLQVQTTWPQNACLVSMIGKRWSETCDKVLPMQCALSFHHFKFSDGIFTQSIIQTSPMVRLILISHAFRFGHLCLKVRYQNTTPLSAFSLLYPLFSVLEFVKNDFWISAS